MKIWVEKKQSPSLIALFLDLILVGASSIKFCVLNGCKNHITFKVKCNIGRKKDFSKVFLPCKKYRGFNNETITISYIFSILHINKDRNMGGKDSYW